MSDFELCYHDIRRKDCEQCGTQSVSSQDESGIVIRCHDCGGTQIWQRNAAGETEVFHDCWSGKHAREVYAKIEAERDREIERLRAEVERLKDEHNEYTGRLWCALGQPMNIEYIAAVGALRAENGRLQWRPITETDLPKVGDEVARFWPEWNGWIVREVNDCDGEDIGDDGWSHFRPINTPSRHVSSAASKSPSNRRRNCHQNNS